MRRSFRFSPERTINRTVLFVASFGRCFLGDQAEHYLLASCRHLWLQHNFKPLKTIVGLLDWAGNHRRMAGDTEGSGHPWKSAFRQLFC